MKNFIKTTTHVSRLLLYLIPIIYSFKSFSQVITFEKNYDTLGFYNSSCLRQTIDSGFIITGARVFTTPTFSTNRGTVFKTDKWGNIQWIKTFNAFFSTIEIVNDTNYLLAGTDINYSHNIFFQLLNQNGDSIWSRRDILINDNHSITGSIKTRDNGFAFTGICPLSVDSPGHTLLIKLSQSLAIEWVKTYSVTSGDEGYGLVQTYNGGFAIAGACSKPVGTDVMLVLTDSLGNLIWQNTFGYSNVDVALSIVCAADKGFFLSGYSWVSQPRNYDGFLLKTDSFGNWLWDKHIGNTFENTFSCMQQLPNGDLVMAGTTAAPSNGYNVWFTKMDNQGNIIVNKNFGHPLSDFGRHIILTNDNGFAIVGDSETPRSIYLIKTDSTSTWINIPEIESHNSKVYPNPASGLIKIKLPSRQHGKLFYEIHDITGKMIISPAIFYDSDMIDVSHLTCGIYFISITTDENKWTEKLIIQR